MEDEEKPSKNVEFSAPIELSTPIGLFTGIKKDEGGYELSSESVDIAAEQSVGFKLTVEKRPMKLAPGSIVNNVVIDPENYGTRMQELLNQADTLRELPEHERPERLMQLMLEKISYAYKEKVSQQPAEERKWVESNVMTTDFVKTNLSEIVEHGFGVCRHLPVLFLVLANHAGLEGSVTSKPAGREKMKNISRKETDFLANDGRATIFRSYQQDDETPIGHSWAEIKVSEDGIEKWIPVDPSTQLIGNTAERLQTFIDAGYISFLRNSLKPNLVSTKTLPMSLKLDFPAAIMRPGDAKSDFHFDLKNGPYKILTIGSQNDRKNRTEKSEPFSGDLKIVFEKEDEIFDSFPLEVEQIVVD